MDGVEAFHAAYARREVTMPPKEYIDLILVPAVLHTPTVDFWAMPEMVQEKTRRLLFYYIAAGWAGKTWVLEKA